MTSTLRQMSADQLIARLEVSTGPDAKLDDDILEYVNGRRRNISTFEQYEPSETPIRYTASIDAALTLVKDDWFVELNRFSDGWYCSIAPHSKLIFESKYKGEQKPGAIALCIAAMKARQP